MILFDEIVNRLARQKALALAPEVCGDQLQISKLGGLIVAPVLQFLDKSAIIALTNSAIQFGKVFHTFFILLFALFVIFFLLFFLFQLLIRIRGGRSCVPPPLQTPIHRAAPHQRLPCVKGAVSEAD